MNKVSGLIALALTVGLATTAQAVCESSPDPKCRLAALESVDQQLNFLYKRLVSTGSSADHDRLRADQREWLARRDTACGLSASDTAKAQGLKSLAADAAKSNCVHAQSLERVRDLQDRPTMAVDQVREILDVREYNLPFTRRTGKGYAEVTFPAKGYPTSPPTPVMQVAMTDGEQLVGMQNHLSSMAGMTNADGNYVVGLAVDLDNGKFYYSENGKWNSAPGSSAGADLKVGSNYSIRLISGGLPISTSLNLGSIRVNSGDSPFSYETPAGYQAFHVTRGGSTGDLPPHLVPSFQRVGGKSLPEWAERYWAWLLPKQPARNPVLDNIGTFCGDDQAGPVWFLSSADAKSRITRSCTIPKGRFILVPAVAQLMYSTAGSQPCSKIEADALGKNGADAIQSVFLSVDGERFEALYDYRVYTPKCTTIRGDAGEKIVSDMVYWGSWLLLYPLSEGDHVISYGGEIKALNLTRSVTYRLRVE